MFSINFSMIMIVSHSSAILLPVVWFVLYGFCIEWSSTNPLRGGLSLMVAWIVEAYAVSKYAS